MGRALLMIACGVLLGLAITWLVSTQLALPEQQHVEPANANAPYSGARPVQEPPGSQGR